VKKPVDEMSIEELRREVTGLRTLTENLSARIKKVHNFAISLCGAQKKYCLTPDGRIQEIGRRLRQIAFGRA
jgi:hypothetical protein